MSMARHWIHIVLSQHLIHVIRVELGIGGEPKGAHVLTYGEVYEKEDFLSYAINESHSDASGMLMAVEMQGGDDFWLELTDAEHASVRDQVLPMQVDPIESLGLRTVAGQVLVLAAGVELDVSAQLAAAGLQP